MKAEDFVKILGADFYTGIPDSQLKALCDYLMNAYGIDPKHHIIAANEGNCAALAAGYHLATGKVPVVYMQNSGEGNIINPAASLLNEKVYAIPVIFVIGWRGEPGIHDEPQHIYQGEITCRLLEDMGIRYHIIGRETPDEEVSRCMQDFREELAAGRDVAFVIRKGALEYDGRTEYGNDDPMLREEIIRCIMAHSGDDPIISTTGKASRELFELRERAGQSHEKDFLTVGSMGHCSSIALGVALHQPDKTVWCIDGDGAALMHMGALPVIANHHPRNLIHVIINNGSHETVGGQPTVMGNLKFSDIARDCGYPHAVTVGNFEELNAELAHVKERKDLTLIEVKCAIGARADLGRPTTTARENKEKFMRFLEAGEAEERRQIWHGR
ncbi:MAG: phosphonopyruvate decarboxylase [Lachnospiraceae bacterium]|nr:phosphonopyruvate decarboxylase [Butyrivibrio sp.]MCM1342426.1 phosphonopyruvate decarboxylase [Muribaculaceae bacterium]MCM1410267.1 phosphonopyruvate decarboxylase [Lachnospiraceae bacterium]